MPELTKLQLIKRELDLDDPMAVLLHGATIKGAYRRRYGEQALILAGLSAEGKPFLLELTAKMDSLIWGIHAGDLQVKLRVPALKEDIDRAEAGDRVKL